VRVPLDAIELGTCEESCVSSETLIPGVAVGFATAVPPPEDVVLLELVSLFDVPQPPATIARTATTAAIGNRRIPLVLTQILLGFLAFGIVAPCSLRASISSTETPAKLGREELAGPVAFDGACEPACAEAVDEGDQHLRGLRGGP
jgi:hypothetical protein